MIKSVSGGISEQLSAWRPPDHTNPWSHCIKKKHFYKTHKDEKWVYYVTLKKTDKMSGEGSQPCILKILSHIWRMWGLDLLRSCCRWAWMINTLGGRVSGFCHATCFSTLPAAQHSSGSMFSTPFSHLVWPALIQVFPCRPELNRDRVVLEGCWGMEGSSRLHRRSAPSTFGPRRLLSFVCFERLF